MRSYICPNKFMRVSSIKPLLMLGISVFFASACAQSRVKKEFNQDLLYRVGFWNLENLMDTINDPGFDDDFTPAGAMAWNTEKLQNKMVNLEKVIHQIHPDIMGFCEVEHEALLKQLISRDSLKKVPYGIVHYESPDERGIDVGLIYNKNKMFVLRSEAIRVQLPDSDNTRDILYVRMLLKTKRDTLNVFVNHWPSRRDGQEASQAKRMAAADTLYHYLQKHQLFTENTIILGDFNDDPTDKSIADGLAAIPPGSDATSMESLYSLNRLISTDTAGTLKFNNHWNMFDQILISPVLWHSSSEVALKYHPKSFQIFAPEWMKQKDAKYMGYPLRTFGGKKWLNGYSDHFPVYAELRYE